MKTAKIFISVLLGFLALAVCSCSSPEYRPTDGNCSFVIKKIDGKRQWGMVDSRNMQVEYIPCQYDSIFSAYGAPYYIDELFVGLKNGKMYAWDYRGVQLLGGKGFISLTSEKHEELLHNNHIVGSGIFNEALTDEGIIFFYLPTGIDWFEFGPAEAVLWLTTEVLCKKNGKWGILWGKSAGHEYLSVIAPFVYDEIICVNGNYFWVKKDGKWSAINTSGKSISKPISLLHKYQKLPSQNYEQYCQAEREIRIRKLSIQEASYVFVPNYKYIAW